jgi:YegS/Rv2252/BmrU family lipid kinase
MSVAVIINPIAGRTRPGAARARGELAAATIEKHGEAADVMITERAGHARLLAAAAVSRGARLVMAWGGDGTINEVASALAFGEVPLGIIPAGSGNGLGTELGVDRRPERAIVNAMRAKPSPIDVGELGGRRFVNVAGIGLDAYVAALFDARGGRRGPVGYVRVVARALLAYVPATYTISTYGFRQTVRALLVVVANSAQYGNGARIAPGARVDDGQLDLVIVEERSRARTVCRLPHLFAGSISRVAGCSIRRTREVTIECGEPMICHVDGEPSQAGTTLRACVYPGALRVCVK